MFSNLLRAHGSSPRSSESSLEVLGGGGVHSLAALDVVLHRDPRIGVPEQLGGEERALRLVDDRGDGTAKAVRGDVLNPGSVHHVAQQPADVVRRVRRPDPRAEQQSAGVGVAATQQARTGRMQRERR